MSEAPEVFETVEEAERAIKWPFIVPLHNINYYVRRPPEKMAEAFQQCLDTIRVDKARIAELEADKRNAIILGIENAKLKFALARAPCEENSFTFEMYKARDPSYRESESCQWARDCGACPPCLVRKEQRKTNNA